MSDPSSNPWPEARALAEGLVDTSGSAVCAVLLYGSRLLKTHPDRHSALDFVVIVNDYRAFYSGLKSAGEIHRPVGLMTWMAGILAPNVIAYTPEDGEAGIAKCLVVSRDHFARALGPTPPDHFLLGRMVQRIGYLWSASPEVEGWVRDQVEGAHARVLSWMAPYLDGPVDAEALGRRLLEVCYQGEYRPESRGRAGRVFEVQADHFRAALEPGLRKAAAAGLMIRNEDMYTLAGAVAPGERRRWKKHFRRSKTRTTLRWFKHSITFANWVPYVVRKTERHTGRTIKLTLIERKLPVLFLWPRAIYMIATRPPRELDP